MIAELIIASDYYNPGFYFICSIRICRYSSDNGGPGHESNNLPVRGAKFGVFEGSFRVPALVHSPLLPPAVVGIIHSETIYVADWYAPFLPSLPLSAALTALHRLI